MKLAIIINDAGQAANCDGGTCEKSVVLMELPENIAEKIREIRKLSTYSNIELALVRE